MKLHNNQSGFSAVEIIIAVVVIALIGFLGYTAYDRFQQNKVDQVSEQDADGSEVSTAPEIKSTSDLDAAEKVLDESDLNEASSTDAKQLDSELSTF